MHKITQNNWLHNLGFWVISFMVLYKVFTKDYQNGAADVVYTLLFHIPLVVLVFSNIYFLRKWVLHKKHWFYFLVMITVLGLCLALYYLIFDFLSDYIFPGFYFISYYTPGSIIQFLVSYWIISSLLLLSRNWFELKDRQLQLEKENSKVTLGALKSQLNPHFLFNSLNNIYSLASPKNPVARDYLMKLSDALRYMLYETNEDFVPLQNEVDYLRDYIDLEKLRLNRPEQVNLAINGNVSGHLIAPLILLPLIENCFKHVHKLNPKIEIMLKINSQGEMFLKTTNHIGASETPGGVGLDNLQKRLDLIYKNKHALTFTQDNEYFKANLQLQLSV